MASHPQAPQQTYKTINLSTPQDRWQNPTVPACLAVRIQECDLSSINKRQGQRS